MSLAALALILVAAVAHASWNLLAKRAGGGAPFLWLIGAASVVLYAPLALAAFLVERPRFGAVELAFVAGSGGLHLLYFLLLQRGYRTGDLSLVYPLARGTGPLLSTIAAIALLGERPTPLALVGAAVVVGSVFMLAAGPRGFGAAQPEAALFGLLCGVSIAAYTIWDKQAVSALLLPPLVYDWGSILALTALLTPVAAARRDEIGHLWRCHRAAVVGVGILSPLSYILVLTAMTFTPVSYVAPAREISILVGTVMGARLLGEGDARRRLAAAAAMVFGVAALALG